MRAILLLAFLAMSCDEERVRTSPPDAEAPAGGDVDWDDTVDKYLATQFAKGKDIFRNDTFGDEAFWGDKLRLHEVVQLASPRQALALGLKVDVEQLPDALVDAIKDGSADLDDPANTVALLRADAVLGVKAMFDDDRMVSIGITCGFCHSTVDDALAPGIGKRLDGWPNRDLDVGMIVSLAPDLTPFEQLLGVSRDEVVAVLQSWGPGRYDAELSLDGKSMPTVMPAAFGLAGQSLHTYTGWGSVPYWNAYVANTQMMGQGTFYDPRLLHDEFPLVTRTGFNDKRDQPDRISSKLEALHLYQLALPAPTPPVGSFDPEAAERGERVFTGKAACARCHVPPLYSEPGWPMHTGAEIGIDNAQADRSPEHMYRTTPLRGLFTRLEPGLYHDGRFETLDAVIDHYEAVLGFTLDADEQKDLVEFLKSI